MTEQRSEYTVSRISAMTEMIGFIKTRHLSLSSVLCAHPTAAVKVTAEVVKVVASTNSHTRLLMWVSKEKDIIFLQDEHGVGAPLRRTKRLS